MIDVTNINYFAILVDGNGKQYDITDYVEDLGWEEPKGEIATKSTLTVRNDKYESTYVSKLIKLGCIVIIMASNGRTLNETSRGKVEIWNPVTSADEQDINVTCYDDLYNLQRSEGIRTIKNKTKAKKAITKIFNEWNIVMGTYNGPTNKLKKLVFNKMRISEMLLKILEEAFKLGEEKYMLRAREGKVDVIPYGDNSDIYVFDVNSTISVNHKESTKDMITRVQIMNSENKKYIKKVNGKTSYGIRQKILTMKNGQSKKEAKAEAKTIISEKGVVEKELTVKAPDIPFLRKGDTVYVDVTSAKGWYDIKGISHDTSDRTMSMDLLYSEAFGQSSNSKKKFKKGQVATFEGGIYHNGYKKKSKTTSAAAGRVKIKKVKKGAAYPYKVVHTTNASNIRGWVSAGQLY